MREAAGQRAQIHQPDLPRHLDPRAVLAPAKHVLEMRARDGHDRHRDQVRGRGEQGERLARAGARGAAERPRRQSPTGLDDDRLPAVSGMRMPAPASTAMFEVRYGLRAPPVAKTPASMVAQITATATAVRGTVGTHPLRHPGDHRQREGRGEPRTEQRDPETRRGRPIEQREPDQDRSGEQSGGAERLRWLAASSVSYSGSVTDSRPSLIQRATVCADPARVNVPRCRQGWV